MPWESWGKWGLMSWATRLQKVIPVIIDSDQVGYIKNRYIGQNIRIIYDLLIHTDENDTEASLTQKILKSHSIL